MTTSELQYNVLPESGHTAPSGTDHRGPSLHVDSRQPSLDHRAISRDSQSSFRMWLNKSWKRIKRATRRARPGRGEPFTESPFQPQVSVRVIVGGKEHRISACMIIDTGSPFNLVSKTFLEKLCPHLHYATERRVIGKSIIGNEDIESVGKLSLDWFGQKRNSHSSRGTTPQFQSRFQTAICEVVECDHFEIILGEPDIIRLELLKPNVKRLGTFIPVPQALSGSSVQQQDANAAERQEKEQQAIEERRKKIKEEKTKKKSDT